MNAERFAVGSPVRIKPDVVSEFAGRDAWVEGENGYGYYVRVGVADLLWFAGVEVEPRDGEPEA